MGIFFDSFDNDGKVSLNGTSYFTHVFERETDSHKCIPVVDYFHVTATHTHCFILSCCFVFQKNNPAILVVGNNGKLVYDHQK